MIDFTGHENGKVKVIGYSHRLDTSSGGCVHLWECQCECGKIWSVRSCNIKKLASCINCRGSKHGHNRIGNKTSEYEIWKGIKKRCYNSKCDRYEDYGGRGIKVCDRWLNSFANFLEDMGERPEGDYSIERIDNNGDYELDNCKWILRSEQSRNTRRNVNITINGETKILADWLSDLRVSETTYYRRIKKGMTPKEALKNL